jgi:hypothetical protein
VVKSNSSNKTLNALREIVWDWSVNKITADTAMWQVVALVNAHGERINGAAACLTNKKNKCKTCPRKKSLKQKKRKTAC